MRHYVVQGETYTLVFNTPEGVPTGNGTVNIQTGPGALALGWTADTTATLSSFSTTASVAPAKYARKITCASVSGAAVGDVIVINAAASGQLQRTTIDGIIGNDVYITDPIEYDTHTTATTIKGIKLYASLTTTHTATRQRNLQVRWECTVSLPGIGAVTRVYFERLDIVNFDYRAQASPPIEYINGIYPNWSELVGRRAQDIKRAVDAALDEMEFELESQNVEPDQIGDTSKLRRVVALWLILTTLEGQQSPDEDKIDRWRARYERAWATLLKAPMWVDRNDDGAINEEGWTAYTIDGDVVYYRTQNPEHAGLISERLGLQGNSRFRVG